MPHSTLYQCLGCSTSIGGDERAVEYVERRQMDIGGEDADRASAAVRARGSRGARHRSRQSARLHADRPPWRPRRTSRLLADQEGIDPGPPARDRCGLAGSLAESSRRPLRIQVSWPVTRGCARLRHEQIAIGWNEFTAPVGPGTRHLAHTRGLGGAAALRWLRRPRVPHKAIEPSPTTSCGGLLAVASVRDRAIVRLMLDTGLRVTLPARE
jgi:hypothetical protein